MAGGRRWWAGQSVWLVAQAAGRWHGNSERSREHVLGWLRPVACLGCCVLFSCLCGLLGPGQASTTTTCCRICLPLGPTFAGGRAWCQCAGAEPCCRRLPVAFGSQGCQAGRVADSSGRPPPVKFSFALCSKPCEVLGGPHQQPSDVGPGSFGWKLLQDCETAKSRYVTHIAQDMAQSQVDWEVSESTAVWEGGIEEGNGFYPGRMLLKVVRAG